jgi:hypothetical protein
MASKKRKRRRPRPAPSPKPAPAAAKPKPVREPIEEERPPAPWGSFPLVELVVLVGIVMLVIGFFFVGGSRGPTLMVTGLALASLAGLELSIREHFAGYRSHSTLLAGVAGMAALLLCAYVAKLTVGVSLIAGAIAGVAAFFLLARAFQARSGRLVKLR